MDRRILAIGIGAIVVTSGVMIVLVLPPPARTTYHYGRNLQYSDPQAILVQLFEVVDCEIMITFTNDSDLLYSVDIEFYEPMQSWEDFTWLDAQLAPVSPQDGNWIGINVGELRGGRILASDHRKVPVKSIDLVLGNSFNHTIMINGYNMTTAVMYDNGVRLTGGELQYQDKDNDGGDVLIFMDDDVNVTDCDFRVGVWGTDTLYLDIRNPVALGGTIDVKEAAIDSVQLLGWTQGGYPGFWRFSRTGTEEMNMVLSADSAHVSLLTQTP